jgi:hypothetical protein
MYTQGTYVQPQYAQPQFVQFPQQQFPQHQFVQQQQQFAPAPAQQFQAVNGFQNGHQFPQQQQQFAPAQQFQAANGYQNGYQNGYYQPSYDQRAHDKKHKKQAKEDDDSKKSKKSKKTDADLPTLGTVLLAENAAATRSGRTVVKSEIPHYPYCYPERCRVCGRTDLGLLKRPTGYKCPDCIGISATPLRPDDLTYGYNPNRYPTLPVRITAEAARYPYRTARTQDTTHQPFYAHPTYTNFDAHQVSTYWGQ